MKQPTRPTRRTSALLLLVLTVAVLGRVSANAPPPGQATPAGCRTYAIDETRKSTRSTMQVKCSAFDKTTLQYVCHGKDSSGFSFDETAQYGSVADFVGDPSKVTFFPHAKTITLKSPTFTSAQVYSYDGQGRPSTIATSVSTGGGTIQTFTAWDPLGRPTAGQLDGQTFTFTYDDAQRIFTQQGTGVLITLKLDANGNHASSTSVGPSSTDNATITVHATAQICK